MNLLERDELLAQLQALWRAAASGPGRLVFIEGEAGIGKTTLLRAFARHLEGRALLSWGACEAMLAPVPLSVLDDIARQCPHARLARLVRAGAERAPLAGSARGGDEYDRRFSRVVQRGTHLLLVLARSESQRQRVEEIVGRCGGHDPQGPAPQAPD